MHGVRSRFGVILAVLLTALAFGLAHSMNALGGQSLTETVNQVLQTAAWGVFYAALRLNAIWPLMIFHALFDFFPRGAENWPVGLGNCAGCRSTRTSVIQNTTYATASIAIGYGLIVLFNYYRSQRSKS